MGDGVLMDISDRRNPVVTDKVRDTANFAFWHSATFNGDGTKVVFTDELGGGGAPTCNEATGDTRGATASTTSGAASWSSAATTRCRAPRPTTRTAWPTTAR